jgi:hypothetical protein
MNQAQQNIQFPKRVMQSVHGDNDESPG